MNKEQIINEIIQDLPVPSIRFEMSDEEWYKWFEECWDKAVDYKGCSEICEFERIDSKRIQCIKCDMIQSRS